MGWALGKLAMDRGSQIRGPSRKLRLAPLWLGAVLIAGCGKMDISAGEKLAARDLLDPSAAQFRDVTAKDHIVCGQINGKNRLGAYTGFKGFIARLESGAVIQQPEEPQDFSLGAYDRHMNDLKHQTEVVSFASLSSQLCGRYVGTQQATLDKAQADLQETLTRLKIQ